MNNKDQEDVEEMMEKIKITKSTCQKAVEIMDEEKSKAQQNIKKLNKDKLFLLHKIIELVYDKSGPLEKIGEISKDNASLQQQIKNIDKEATLLQQDIEEMDNKAALLQQKIEKRVRLITDCFDTLALLDKEKTFLLENYKELLSNYEDQEKQKSQLDKLLFEPLDMKQELEKEQFDIPKRKQSVNQMLAMMNELCAQLQNGKIDS